ncbi:MAG: Mrp/NBP35 family ATP-binding protein, partial [Dehalococcoidales bacterium]|nr:Mrp/NBP35 family ATP-binding protein [Dehalococcoidales bacterium]
MTTEEHIRESLDKILVPGAMRSLTKMNLVRNIVISDGKASITLSSAALSPEIQDRLKESVKEATGKLDGVNEVTVDFSEEKPKDLNQIKNVIAVMSGKGGVGKSLVTSLVSVTLQRQGYEVGILDADITGPSIPKMFGIANHPAGSDTGLLPVPSRSGIEIMSINLLLPGEDEAVIWRGPLIARAITQFWEEVLWGQLDYLIVDLPPGTADAPLTVLQTLPVTGVIIVFTPQDLTNMVVRKAVKMALQMDKSILGVVENMSYLYVPEIDKKMEIFGRSRGDEMAKTAGAPLLARIPIDPELARLCDEGTIERYDSEVMNGLKES